MFRIRNLRKSKGLTQVELAEKTSTMQAHILRIEAGETNTTTQALAKIAGALDV